MSVGLYHSSVSSCDDTLKTQMLIGALKMKVFIFVSFLAFSLAEPPVGDSYAPARSSHSLDHDRERFLSQEYGVPEFGARNQKDYSLTSARSQPSQIYGSPVRSSISQEYNSPNLRSAPSQEYGTPSYRSNPSLEYGVPKSRSLSQRYGPPALRNPIISEPNTYQPDFEVQSARSAQDFIPQSKSASSQFNSSVDFPSDTYGTPLQRSLENRQHEHRNPSVEYGVPSQRVFDQSPSQKYGPPNFRNTQSFGQDKSLPTARFSAKTSSVSRNYQTSFSPRNPVSQTYSVVPPRSLSTQYGAPNSRIIDSYSPTSKSISQTYLPSSRTVSQSYGVPSERGLPTEYGVPEVRTNLRTNAITSQFNLPRSSPSDKYGVPEARMPSEQYGVPEQYEPNDSQEYNYARNALDELLNQEPANYDFGYKVNDFESGSDFGHTETRHDNKAEGSYFVVLPDGTKQVVEYEADERGFKPRISVEPAEARTGGYDGNAANIERSGDGPY